MNNELQSSLSLSQREAVSNALPGTGNASCELDAEGHCITCSDEALEARVLRVEQQAGIAFVVIKDVLEEVDITLLEDVVPGNVLLVHGGVAIANIVGEALRANDG